MRKKLEALVLTGCLLAMGIAGCANADQSTSDAGTTDSVAEAEESTASEAEESTASGEEDLAEQDSEEKMIVGFDMNSNTCPYCLKFSEYIDQYATEAGFEVIITQSDGDVVTQLSNIDSMLVNGASIVSGIFGDKDASLPVVDSCRDYDAVCISTLTSLSDEGNGYEKYIYVGSENYDGGYMQGEWLAENLPEGKNIWYLGATAGDQQGIDRRQGLEDALKDAGRDDVQIIASEYTNNMMDQGLEVMENWIQAYDTIDCVVGSADLSVLGAIEAAKAADRMDDTIWVGLDGQDVALESIQNGEMDMTVFQDADSQAKALVEIFERIRDGEDPSTIEDALIPFKAITAENVSEFMES